MTFPSRLFILLLLVQAPLTQAVPDLHPTFSLVRIFVADHDELKRIFDAGLDFEGVTGRPGGWMEFVVGPGDKRELELRGIAYQTVDPDLAVTMTAHLSPVPENALGFGFGSMGGYYTYAEIGQQLDSMKLLHPGLITSRQVIGSSHEGREIWAVKISDNPDIAEADEPEALYTALHHAREPAGMMSVIYYMWWLIENYGTDPEATYLVDNRQIWFIPVVNPDGYVYNESTNPSGGGMWRKNRRDNGDGYYGVDQNRNYGPEYMWDSPNGGSSTSTWSSTYRGLYPFSEPENEAVDGFMRSHQIRTCLNYHTHSRLLIYPYGYISAESEDSLIYREYAFDMVRINRYASGIDKQTVNYSTRGNSDDYMYGDPTKPRTFAMTPEVGSSFWPASSLILPLAQENLRANIIYSHVAGPTPVLDRFEPDSATAAGGLLSGGSYSFSLGIRNRGLGGAAGVTVSFSADSGWVGFSSPSVFIDTLGARSDTSILLSGSIAGGVGHGVGTRIYVDISDPDGYSRRDTIPVFLGPPQVIFSDDAESGIGAWSAGGTWGITFDTAAGSFVFEDSPGGNYASSTSTSLELSSPLSLVGLTGITLRFQTLWAIEPSRDFGLVEISTNGGAAWSSVGSPLSNTGSGYGAQVNGTVGYDGYTPGGERVRQEIDLTPYAGSEILIRFRLATNGDNVRDGWQLDDITLTGYHPEIGGSPLAAGSVLSGTRSLFFGEYPGATDGIDSLFGEIELPPGPPPDSFDLRWVIPGTNGVAVELKDTLSPPSGVNTFTLAIQATPGDYPVTLGWDRDLLTQGGWRIRDALTAGSVFDLDMWLGETVTITDASVSSVEIIHSLSATSVVSFAQKWNMVSLPVLTPDRSVAGNFPGAISPAFFFDGSYHEAESLQTGIGYWLNLQGPGSVPLSGIPHSNGTVENTTGSWVLFGASYCPLARIDICPSCTDVPLIFGYRNGYYLADTLYPGEAYWYSGTDALDLSCDGPGPGLARRRSDGIFAGFNELHFSDESGRSAHLYFRTITAAGTPGASYALPPAPPEGIFDVRFDTQTLAEYFVASAGTTSRTILVTPGTGKMDLTFQSRENGSRRYEIRITRPDGSFERHRLTDGVTINTHLPADGRIGLHAGGDPAQPTAFRLHGNYPNPFNPRTRIGFDLPEEAAVSITIRNIAGQEVARLLSGTRHDPGRHDVTVEAGALATGTYFYTLTALPSSGAPVMNATGKFLIIR